MNDLHLIYCLFLLWKVRNALLAKSLKLACIKYTSFLKKNSHFNVPTAFSIFTELWFKNSLQIFCENVYTYLKLTNNKNAPLGNSSPHFACNMHTRPLRNIPSASIICIFSDSCKRYTLS